MCDAIDCRNRSRFRVWTRHEYYRRYDPVHSVGGNWTNLSASVCAKHLSVFTADLLTNVNNLPSAYERVRGVVEVHVRSLDQTTRTKRLGY